MPNFKEWDVESVLRRFPNCSLIAAPEVARCLREVRNRKREDTGEHLTTEEAMSIYYMAINLAGENVKKNQSFFI